MESTSSKFLFQLELIAKSSSKKCIGYFKILYLSKTTVGISWGLKKKAHLYSKGYPPAEFQRLSADNVGDSFQGKEKKIADSFIVNKKH